MVGSHQNIATISGILMIVSDFLNQQAIDPEKEQHGRRQTVSCGRGSCI